MHEGSSEARPSTLLEWSLGTLGVSLLLGGAIQPGGPLAPAVGLAGWICAAHLGPLLLLAVTLLLARRRVGSIFPLVRGWATVPLALGAGLLGAWGGLLAGPSSAIAMAPPLSEASARVWAVLWVGIAVPIAEEGFFRGALLGGLRERAGPLLAVPLSAALFALAHVGLVPYGYAAVLALLGLGLATAAGVAGALLPAIAGHTGWNLASLWLGEAGLMELAAPSLAWVGCVLLVVGVATRLLERGRAA